MSKGVQAEGAYQVPILVSLNFWILRAPLASTTTVMGESNFLVSPLAKVTLYLRGLRSFHSWADSVMRAGSGADLDQLRDNCGRYRGNRRRHGVISQITELGMTSVR